MDRTVVRKYENILEDRFKKRKLDRKKYYSLIALLSRWEMKGMEFDPFRAGFDLTEDERDLDEYDDEEDED